MAHQHLMLIENSPLPSTERSVTCGQRRLTDPRTILATKSVSIHRSSNDDMPGQIRVPVSTSLVSTFFQMKI